MNPDDIVKYKSLYLQTSWGYLNMLQKNVAFLLKDPQEEKAIDASHLAAHSLKSQSALMGYNQIGKIAGQMEEVFRAVKEKTFVLQNDLLGVVLSALSKIHFSLEQIAENGAEVDMTDEANKLDALFKQTTEGK